MWSDSKNNPRIIMARGERPNAQLLFKQLDGFGVQEHQKAAMLAEIDGAGVGELDGDVEVLAADFAERYSLETPTLIEGAISMDAEEATVDVTGDWRYGAFGNEQSFTSGVRVSFYVPFAGDPQMFQCSASTRNLSMRPAELRKNDLVFTYERPGQNLATIKTEFDKELRDINETLRWQQNDFRTFNASLPGLARVRIEAKRKRQAELSSQINALGVPIKKARTAPAPPASAPPKAAPKKRGTSAVAPDYDVTLSFAGENRDYVEKVAQGLKAAGVNVFL
jgi:hypothetical protein